MAPRLSRSVPVRAPIPMPVIGDDDTADATRQLALAMGKLAKSIDRATDTMAPAAEVLGGMGHRLDALCAFFRKWGPRIYWSAPVVLVGIGAVTPTAGKTLATVLEALKTAAGA